MGILFRRLPMIYPLSLLVGALAFIFSALFFYISSTYRKGVPETFFRHTLLKSIA
ncbi:hypothetical protein TF3313_0292 [Tannerella forsythia 3313]|nr:hypothetical protein TF3313_0292 [Tannerella forsythia 3313]